MSDGGVMTDVRAVSEASTQPLYNAQKESGDRNDSSVQAVPLSAILLDLSVN